MKRHDLVCGSDERSSDEHCRDDGAGDVTIRTPEPGEVLLDLPPFGVVVELVYQRVDIESLEEDGDCIAHAARALGEDQDPVFGGQPLHFVHDLVMIFPSFPNGKFFEGKKGLVSVKMEVFCIILFTEKYLGFCT